MPSLIYLVIKNSRDKNTFKKMLENLQYLASK